MAIHIMIPEKGAKIDAATGFEGTNDRIETMAMSKNTYASAIGISSEIKSIKLKNNHSSAAVAALTEDLDSLGGTITSDIDKKGPVPQMSPAAGNQMHFEKSQSGRLINIMGGEILKFPCQQQGSFTPAEMAADVTYHNNISGMGQFIGRSVVRSSYSASLQPVSFTASSSRIDDVMEVLKTLREGPTYFRVDGPGGKIFVWYGWTDAEPSVSYTGELDRMTISMDLTVI